MAHAKIQTKVSTRSGLWSRRRGGQPPLAAAFVAGVLSALVAVTCLALGSQVLDGYVWALVVPLSLAPVPELPHPNYLPDWLITWGQQYLLMAHPIVTTALTALGLRLRKPRWASWVLDRVVPDSLGGRLRATLAGLTALTFVVGWVGFSALEDVHFRGHQLQLVARWQTTLDQVGAALDAKQAAHVGGDTVQRMLDGLEQTDAYPGVAVSAEDVHVFYGKYDALVDELREAQADYNVQPEDAGAREALHSALRA